MPARAARCPAHDRIIHVSIKELARPAGAWVDFRLPLKRGGHRGARGYPEKHRGTQARPRGGSACSPATAKRHLAIVAEQAGTQAGHLRAPATCTLPPGPRPWGSANRWRWSQLVEHLVVVQGAAGLRPITYPSRAAGRPAGPYRDDVTRGVRRSCSTQLSISGSPPGSPPSGCARGRPAAGGALEALSWGSREVDVRVVLCALCCRSADCWTVWRVFTAGVHQVVVG